MAITTKTTYTHNGITYGLSDDCNSLFTGGNLTASELARFSWCRWSDKYLTCMLATNINILQEQGAAVMGLLSYFNHDGETGYLKTKYVDDRIQTVTPYAFNILVYGDTFALNINSDNGANYKIVTSCSDFQKLYVKVNSYSETDLSVQFPEARTIKNNRLTWLSDSVYNTDNNQYSAYIKVCTVYVLDENNFFITKGMAFPGCTPGLYDGVLGAAQSNIRPSNYLYMTSNHANSKWRYTYGDITTYDKSKHLARWYKNGLNIPDVVTWSDNTDKIACWDVDSDVSVFMNGYWGVYRYTYFLRTENAIKNAIAYCGLRWKYNTGDTEHIYTPIIDSDNYVTGWSTDPAAESKLNDIADVTGNNITPLPPIPPVSGDKIDDMNVNPLWAMSSDAGFARYFLMSNDQIGSLQTWLSDTTFPDGYDPYPYIISLIQFPLKLSPDYCMPRTPSGHIVIGGEDTGITASLISNEKAWKGLGTYDVPRENGNFLDYSPYSQYEVYIPCCGWVTCPDIIAGRKIAVKINYDLTTAAIIGNVYVTIDGKEMIVASKSGMMGRETIVSGDAAGVRSAQITSALLSAGTGALNVATGAMSGNAVAAVSGGYHVVAGLAQANIAANSSYARTVGSTGGRALLCQYDKCYLKICTTEADIPAGYSHTVGYICNKSGKVSDFRGYTVFDNFDVTGITGLTQRELMEVKRIMESGVYINSPPQ